MSTNPTLNLSLLDFNEIKIAIKEFLRQKPEFQDYDFEGSGWNYLIDILAYNTAYNGFYLNMVGNEMFLDTAQQRGSIVSKAKLIGYMPRSINSARARIRVELTPDPSKPIPQQIFISRDAGFMGVGTNQERFQFVSQDSHVLYLVNPSGDPSDYDPSTQTFSKEIDIIEGTRLSFRFLITPDKEQRFILPNENVDTSSIRVWIQKSATNISLTPFNLATEITEVEADSKVFYLQYNEDNLCEIYFGDGVISAGFQVDSLGNISSNGLEPGNIVVVEYIVPSGGVNANRIRSFSPIQKIGSPLPVESEILVERVFTVTPAYGAKDPESDQEIKYYAPINYEMQNRAVTELDFERYVVQKYPYIDSIAVWGGEENIPVQYGRVFISIKPSSGYVLNNEDKDIIVNEIIRPRCVVTQDPIIVDPDYLYLKIYTNVKFSFRNSTQTLNDIQYAVFENIEKYSDEVLEKFGRNFAYSDFVCYIDNTDPGIFSNITSISLKKIIYPTIGISETYNIHFANELDLLNVKDNIYRKAVYSTPFKFLNDDTTCIFAEADFGSSTLSIFKINLDNTIEKIRDVGTINAVTGEIEITQRFTPFGWVDGINRIEFFASPKNYDINSERNLILVIDSHDINVKVENKPL